MVKNLKGSEETEDVVTKQTNPRVGKALHSNALTPNVLLSSSSLAGSHKRECVPEILTLVIALAARTGDATI